MAFYPCLQAVNSGEVIIKKMQQEFVTSSSQLMCVANASSDYGADWPAWKAFTNNANDCWIAGAADSWWSVQFPTAVNITEIKYANLDGNRFHQIDEIYISDDGTTWTQIAPLSSAAGLVVLPNNITSVYWRFNFYGYSDSSQYPLLAHLELWGYTAAVPTPPSIELIENITTSGSSTYTITEDGLYLLIVSDSYQGSRGITLPSGRTAIINETVETSYGSTIVVVELQANDVVTLDATPNNWLAFSKQIYKLSNFSIVSLYGKQANNDGTYSYTVPAIGQYLVVGICFGLSTQVKQYTDETEQSIVCRRISNEVGLYTYTTVCIDEGPNIPELTLFGYDGGGVNYLALNVTY